MKQIKSLGHRADQAKGFVALPKRWIVERTNRLTKPLPPPRQRLGKSQPQRSGFLHLASIRFMLRKLCTRPKLLG
jgi:transposase